MPKSFRLIILTPYSRYFDNQVSFLEVKNEKASLGITAGHSPLISPVSIGLIKIRIDTIETLYACGGGVVNIEKDKVTLILNSIESENEIDKKRAELSKERALNRLNNPNKEEIDIARAEASLKRALTRIALTEIRK